MAAESAQRVYERLGWSVIPVDTSDKHPLIPWRTYANRKPSSFEIHEWTRRFPRAGIAVICGAVSGLLVLDADGPLGTAEAIQRGFPESPMVETPSGGRHIYFKNVEGFSFKNGAKLGSSKKIDVRSDSGYVIAPPSTRVDGRRYRWLTHPDQVGLKDPPEWFLQMLKSSRAANQPLRAPLSVGSKAAVRQGATEGGGDWGCLPWLERLPLFARKLVLEGHDLERYPSRSECDLEVVQRLLCVGAPLDVIQEVFATYAIGEKYNESGEGSRYLEKTITAALNNVKQVRIKYADIREYDQGKRLHLALDVSGEGRLVRSGLTVPTGNKPEIAIRWQALFDACGVRVPGFGRSELELACRSLVGKKMRILFSEKRENPVVGFYAL